MLKKIILILTLPANRLILIKQILFSAGAFMLQFAEQSHGFFTPNSNYTINNSSPAGS